MQKRLTLSSIAIVIALFGGAVPGQRATEIHIPIGKSPGMSGISTIMGSIDGTDDHQLTISNASGTYQVAVVDGTKIWLDKSPINQQNETGTTADFKPGRKVEVKYVDSNLTESVTAEWIKVQIAN